MTDALAHVQAQFCAWLTEPDEDRARALIAPLDLGPGLVVYQNNYRVALVEALRETHARAALWLGDAAFEAAAATFIDAHPPVSWTIDAYGIGFPAALAATYPDDPIAADLATIDRAIGEAFVAADADAVDASALAEIDWDTAIIGMVPSAMVVTLQSNADAVWLALTNDEPLPAPCGTEQPVDLLLWRQAFEPVMRRADPAEIAIFDHSRSGMSFADICNILAAHGDPQAAVTMAGTVLGRWLGEGLVAGFDADGFDRPVG